MKVILLKDVPKIGRRFEVKEVPSGHALNYLIPRREAEPATPEGLKRLEQRKAKMTAVESARSESFKGSLMQIAAAPITMYVEANGEGHLFKGVKAEDIAELLTKEGLTIDYDHIVLDRPIKNVGEYDIPITDGENEGVIKLVVTAAGK